MMSESRSNMCCLELWHDNAKLVKNLEWQSGAGWIFLKKVWWWELSIGNAVHGTRWVVGYMAMTRGEVAASSRDMGVVSIPSLRCRSGTGYLQRAAKASVAYRALPL